MRPDEELFRAVGAAKNGKDLSRAFTTYRTVVDQVSASIAASSSVPLACREGCAFCCHIPVGARAHEILLLADYIRSHFSTDQQSALIERLRQHVAVVEPMTVEQQHTTNIPCPLLDGSRCSVYVARPMACRAYHSLDVSSCQYSYEHPTDLSERRDQHEELTSAWHQMAGRGNGAFQAHGYDPTPYELGSALLSALTNTATARRFHRGHKAFPGARQL